MRNLAYLIEFGTVTYLLIIICGFIGISPPKANTQSSICHAQEQTKGGAVQRPEMSQLSGMVAITYVEIPPILKDSLLFIDFFITSQSENCVV